MKRLLLTIFLFIFFPLNIYSLNLPKLYSDKVLVYELETEKIIHEQNIDVITSIASLTKIATTIVAIENIPDLDEYVTITTEMLREVPYDASIAGLKAGSRVTYRDLLYASILPSGADATIALAHSISGSIKNFVEQMNGLAKRLELKNTHFVNVTGYDAKDHHSTPEEVLKILLYALKNPLFETIYKTKEYTLSNGLKVGSTLNMYNKFLNADVSSIKGSKTGFTKNAGVCMSALIEIDNREYIVITLGAPHTYGKAYNLEDTLTIKNYIENHYKKRILFEEGTELKELPIEYSKKEKYIIKIPSTISKYLEDVPSKEDLRVDYEGLEKLNPKNKKGDRIGKINYYFKDQLVLEEDIFLEIDIDFSLGKFLKIYFLETIGIILVVALLILIKIDKKKRKRKRK